MSPALVPNEMQQDLQLRTLARGFEALLLTTQQLGYKERVLQQRLKYVSDQYLQLADQLPNGPDTHTKIVSEKIHNDLSEFDYPHKQTLNPSDVVKALTESGNVGYQTLAAITEGLECYRSIFRPQDDSQLSDLNPCPVASGAGVSGNLEKDFTTKGTQGSLRCPFAKPNNKSSENGVSNGIEDAFKTQNDACGHEDLDPIKAEQNDRRSSLTGSAKSMTTRCLISRCPIRFLDQHSPEEVAEYVERHKHEIPRSHAICVQRYQKDSQSMRQLDAKYGNLINMIQGLSAKHKAFLPGRNQDGEPTSSSSAERVERWADDVSSTSPEPEMPAPINKAENEDDREGRFDRPLREVRVGESPSRPWGIPVPIPLPSSSPTPDSAVAPVPISDEHQSNKSPDATGHVSSIALPHDLSAKTPAAGVRTSRCPFGHGGPKPDKPAPEPETETIRAQERKDEAEGADAEPNPSNKPNLDSTPNIVFNGPVFFGFSPDQTAQFIQQLGSLINKQA